MASDGAMAWGRAPDHEIAANRREFLVSRGCPPERGVAIDQVHGDRIVRASEEDMARGIDTPDSRIPEADGMITDIQELVLITSHADCAPVFLLDEENRAIGLVHAGRKGTLSGICGKTVQEMHKQFGTTSQNLALEVGPMISTFRYEVSHDLAKQFTNKFGAQVVSFKNNIPYLDLFSCIVVDVMNHGLRPERIPNRPPCTYNNPQYSSFRRDGEQMRGMITYYYLHSYS